MKYIITTGGNILLVVQGDSYTVTPHHIRYNEILGVLRDPPVDEEQLFLYLHFEEECKAASLEVTDHGSVTVDGKFVPGGAEDLRDGVSPGNIALKAQMTVFAGESEDDIGCDVATGMPNLWQPPIK